MYEFSLPRMGTTLHLKFYAANAVEAGKAANAVFDRVEDLEQTFSDYRDDSELTQLSREGGNAPRVVSPEMFEILESSLRISELSGGAFDITVGPVVALWREARRTHVMPDAAALVQAKAAVGYRNIELDARNRTVFLKRRDMKLDVGAIAKGYAADQALALLEARGINRALVGAGGDLRIGAPPPGKLGWDIVVDSPDTASGRRPCTLLLHDVGISTSGNSHQFADIQGRHFSHIIDPATGMGLEGGASSTVIARNGTTADGLATALSVMPPEAGLRAVESVEGASAYLVRQSPQGWEYYSSRGFPQACNEPGKRGR
jgi:thiamine biosynthesis lipoprotein